MFYFDTQQNATLQDSTMVIKQDEDTAEESFTVEDIPSWKPSISIKILTILIQNLDYSNSKSPRGIWTCPWTCHHAHFSKKGMPSCPLPKWRAPIPIPGTSTGTIHTRNTLRLIVHFLMFLYDVVRTFKAARVQVRKTYRYKQIVFQEKFRKSSSRIALIFYFTSFGGVNGNAFIQRTNLNTSSDISQFEINCQSKICFHITLQ